MPQWLDSMSKDDGIPDWLEPIKPKPTATGVARRQSEVIYATGVHGALMELEKWIPTAGLAIVQVLFPSGLEYNDQSIRDNVHKKFWKREYHTSDLRKRAEARRRKERQDDSRMANETTPRSLSQNKMPLHADV